MWSKELEQHIRQRIEDKGVSLYTPYAMDEEMVKKFWPRAFASVRKILYSYRAKRPETKRKFLEQAEAHMAAHPEEYLLIKKQLDYKHNQ